MKGDDLDRASDKAAAPPPRDDKEKSLDLKRRIDEAKRRHDMPLDANLGDPNWEERAADGHLDLPDNEED